MQHGPHICTYIMSVMHSVCLSPILLCGNNFEIYDITHVSANKKRQKIRKTILDILFETCCVDDNNEYSIYSEAHNNR